MNSSERTSRVNGLIVLVVLFFGGAFPGIVLLAVANQFHGWPVAVLWFFGTALWQKTLRESGKRWPILRAGILAVIVLVIFQFVLAGLAALAAGGSYGSDNTSMGYGNAEYYLTIAVLWLLLGVPQRAFRLELDSHYEEIIKSPNGEGTVRNMLVGLLAWMAAILSGIYILLLHFGNGPLKKIGIDTLGAGVIFTIVLLVPAYKSLATTCWQRGIRNTLLLKPLIMRWSKTLTELDTLDREAQRELQQILESHNKPGLESESTARDASNDQRSTSERGVSRRGVSPTRKKSKGAGKTTAVTGNAQKWVSMQRSSPSGTRPTRGPLKWTRPTRRT